MKDHKNQSTNPTETTPAGEGKTESQPAPETEPREGVTPAHQKEIKATKARGDQSDLNEDFDRYAKAAQMTPNELSRAYHKIRLRLHSANMEVKRRHSFYLCPVVIDLIRLMSGHLQIPIGELIETAILMYFDTVLSGERQVLNELGIGLDALTLQVAELGIESDKIVELAAMALESEFSPLEGKNFPEIASKDKE